MHAMVHRGGVLGWPEPLPAVAKYAYQYLFTQAEFGLMCPVSVTDTSIHLIRRFGSDELKAQLLPRMTSQDLATLWKGTQFMTERAGGSDVGAIETIAPCVTATSGGCTARSGSARTPTRMSLCCWRGRRARPRGTAGLALFAMPRHLEDGGRNSYRIVRLKDKLGTRSMASGEILLEGARAWLVGDERRGFRQMMEQVNLSRLSHGVRAAAMMRRCFNEARAAAAGRVAFGRRLDQMPMVRRQLLEILLPAEQALSLSLFAAAAMDAAGDGAIETGAGASGARRDAAPTEERAEAAATLRILTPLLKLRACRDNVRAATAAMEIRGGNGYIEEWANARLVRDAHIGVLWEGTSNMVALDVVTRAAAKENAHLALQRSLHRMLDQSAPPAPELVAAARAQPRSRRRCGRRAPAPTAPAKRGRAARRARSTTRRARRCCCGRARAWAATPARAASCSPTWCCAGGSRRAIRWRTTAIPRRTRAPPTSLLA